MDGSFQGWGEDTHHDANRLVRIKGSVGLADLVIQTCLPDHTDVDLQLTISMALQQA